MADDEELLAAVRRLRLEKPEATAKQIHETLGATELKDATLSQVKRACSKVTKALAAAGELPAAAASSSSDPQEDAVKQKAMQLMANTDAARQSTADCAICLESLISTGSNKKKSKVETLGCGHRFHKACWKKHVEAHIETIVATAGEKATMGARCPICKAWHGHNAAYDETLLSRRPWHTKSAAELMDQMLGYVYQSRWQDAGKDPGIAEERAFIDEHIRLVQGSIQAGRVSGLDAALVRFRETIVSKQGQDLSDKDLDEIERFGDAFLACCIVHVMPGQGPTGAKCKKEDKAYSPYVHRFMETMGLAEPWQSAKAREKAVPAE